METSLLSTLFVVLIAILGAATFEIGVLSVCFLLGAVLVGPPNATTENAHPARF